VSGVRSGLHRYLPSPSSRAPLAGADVPAKEGDLVPVAFGTVMQIRNDGKENASFLIVKTPNPSEMKAEGARWG
jgi:hypothetical protein